MLSSFYSFVFIIAITTLKDCTFIELMTVYNFTCIELMTAYNFTFIELNCLALVTDSHKYINPQRVSVY